MNKKGVAGLWIWVLISIFVVGVVFISVSPVMKTIHTKFTGDLTGEESVTASKILKAWNAWPLLFILLGAIVMVVGSIQNARPPDQGYF